MELIFVYGKKDRVIRGEFGERIKHEDIDVSNNLVRDENMKIVR